MLLRQHQAIAPIYDAFAEVVVVVHGAHVLTLVRTVSYSLDES